MLMMSVMIPQELLEISTLVVRLDNTITFILTASLILLGKCDVSSNDKCATANHCCNIRDWFFTTLCATMAYVWPLLWQ
jgi:hypothetical protein